MAFLDENGGLKLSRQILGSTVLMFGGIDQSTQASSILPSSTTDSNYSVSKIKWISNAKCFAYALDGKYYNNFGDPAKVSCGDTYQTDNGTSITPKKCLYFNIGNRRLYYWNGISFDQLTDSDTTYSFSNGIDGSFTVTPSGSSAQKISIGTPAEAGKVSNYLQITLNGSVYQFDGSAQKSLTIDTNTAQNGVNSLNTRVNSLENTVASALVYKGTISNNDGFTALLGDGKAKIGYCYIVTATVALSSENNTQINNSTKQLEAGDMLICRTNYTSSNGVVSKQTFDVLQANTNNAITGTGTIGRLAAFSGTNTLVNAGPVGSSTQPMYIKGGVPTPIDYTIQSSVPANAKFTDTVYAIGVGLDLNDKTVNLLSATSTYIGGIKTGYTTSGKNYPVQLDSNQRAYVNVPWTDNNTTYNVATSSTLGLVRLASDTVQSTAANAVTSTGSRTYAVQKNSSNQLVVNVPWSNTTYSAITESTINSWF